MTRTENDLILLNEKGKAVPFDPVLLRKRIKIALEQAGSADPALAEDIAQTVDLALHEQNRITPGMILASELEIMTIRILERVGNEETARIFRSSADAETTAFLVERSRIRSCLQEQFPASDEALSRITEKVYHTLQSIGAAAAQPALIVELGRYFREKDVPVRVEMPVLPNAAECTVTSAMIAEKLPDGHPAKNMLEWHILRIPSFDLRVFPVLRMEICLTARKDFLPDGILTELALMPFFYRIADGLDAIAFAADAVCFGDMKQPEKELKTILYFADMSDFTKQFMGCVTEDEVSGCASMLASLFCANLARRPLRIQFR